MYFRYSLKLVVMRHQMYLGYIKARTVQILLLLHAFYSHIAYVCVDVTSEAFCLCYSQKRAISVVAYALLLLYQKLCEFFFYTYFARIVVKITSKLALVTSKLSLLSQTCMLVLRLHEFVLFPFLELLYSYLAYFLVLLKRLTSSQRFIYADIWNASMPFLKLKWREKGILNRARLLSIQLCNLSHNILQLSHVLVIIWFTASKRNLVSISWNFMHKLRHEWPKNLKFLIFPRFLLVPLTLSHDLRNECWNSEFLTQCKMNHPLGNKC